MKIVMQSGDIWPTPNLDKLDDLNPYVLHYFWSEHVKW